MERDSKDPDEEGRLLQPAQLLEISAEFEEQYKAYYRALKKLSPDLTSDKRKREDIYKVIVAEALTTKLSLYPTTIEQDRLLLARTDISDRHRMAMQVRLGEKLLLEEGLSLISNSAEEDIDSEVITKKRKQ